MLFKMQNFSNYELIACSQNVIITSYLFEIAPKLFTFLINKYVRLTKQMMLLRNKQAIRITLQMSIKYIKHIVYLEFLGNSLINKELKKIANLNKLKKQVNTKY